jgi:hypothetical protein
MSSLYLNARPWTVFNPDNDDHRRYYYDFVSTGTWGRCPVRFVVPEAHGDLISMIQRSLIKWYVIQRIQTPAPTSTHCMTDLILCLIAQ